MGLNFAGTILQNPANSCEILQNSANSLHRLTPAPVLSKNRKARGIIEPVCIISTPPRCPAPSAHQRKQTVRKRARIVYVRIVLLFNPFPKIFSIPSAPASRMTGSRRPIVSTCAPAQAPSRRPGAHARVEDQDLGGRASRPTFLGRNRMHHASAVACDQRSSSRAVWGPGFSCRLESSRLVICPPPSAAKHTGPRPRANGQFEVPSAIGKCITLTTVPIRRQRLVVLLAGSLRSGAGSLRSTIGQFGVPRRAV
jgi:hypothetical protein